LFNATDIISDGIGCLMCYYADKRMEFRTWDLQDAPVSIMDSLEFKFIRETNSWVKHLEHSQYCKWSQGSTESAAKNAYNVLFCNFEDLATGFPERYLRARDIPREMQTCPLFVPDEMGVCLSKRDDPLEKDCLGRTWLHQYLDLRNNSSIYWQIDQDIIKDNFGHSNGFDFDRKDIIGRTPLHIACEKGFVLFAEKLIQLGADVTKKTIFMMTPLHLAAASGSERIVELLRSHRINVNAQDINGCTHLHYAYRHNHVGICRNIRTDERMIQDVECKSIVCKNMGYRHLLPIKDAVLA
jgi:hypothetical protein